MRVVNPEIVERLTHVEVGFAGGDDAEPRPGTVDDDAVQPIGAGESQCRVELVFMKPEFLIERLIGPANIQSAGWHLELLGEHDLGALRADLDRGRTVHRLCDRLKGYPTPGVARHGPTIEAEIEDFLHSRRVEYRDTGIHKGVFGLMRQSRRFAGVVVAGKEKHPTTRCRTGGVAVLQGVATAVDPGSLAVPQGEDAVVLGPREQTDLLTAPNRRRAELFVDCRLKAYVVALEKPPGAPQALVKTAQRRTAIAGDETGRVETGRGIALALHDRQTHQRLGAGQIDPSSLQRVLVVEGDRRQRHHDLRALPL